MPQQRYLAPAKINRFLHVLGRQANGYHQLQTVFQLIDWADELEFELRSDSQITRVTAIQGVPEAHDLTLRAAHLLQQATGCVQGVQISLQKNLPIGSGLGGGSSDAATTLWALNQLWKLGLKRAQLMQLALKLGADVPFFLFGSNAFAQGIGEKLTPLALPDTTFLLVIPPVSVPTTLIFSAPELTRNTPAVKIADFSIGAKHYLTGFGKNDLEPIAAARFVPITHALEVLRQLCPQSEVRMSGSGSSVYAIIKPNESLSAAGLDTQSSWNELCDTCQKILGIEYDCRIVKGLKHHPEIQEEKTD